MFKRLLLLASAAALVVPAAALAAPPSTSVSGKAVLLGRGRFRAELTASAGAKPVRVLGRLGAVRFVDLGGDMKVTCGGKGASRATQNDQGQNVVTCAGLRGRAGASGSHFRIGGFALRFALAIPEGYTGTVEGHVRSPQASGGASAADAQSPPALGQSGRSSANALGAGRDRAPLRRLRSLRPGNQKASSSLPSSASSGLASALANG